MLVKILSDDWNTFGQEAVVIDESPRPGSTMMWVRLSDGTMMAVARHEVEVIDVWTGKEHGPGDGPRGGARCQRNPIDEHRASHAEVQPGGVDDRRDRHPFRTGPAKRDPAHEADGDSQTGVPHRVASKGVDR